MAAAAAAPAAVDAAAHQESADFSPYRTDGKLYGFVCIVTGATQPVGRAIVLELAAHGAACIYACSSTPNDDFARVEQDVNKQYPNTKVIGQVSQSHADTNHNESSAIRYGDVFKSLLY